MIKINYPTWLVHVYAKLKPACANNNPLRKNEQ
jgi:hypothetical protein